MDMLLAKKRSEDRRNWLQEKGDMADLESWFVIWLSPKKALNDYKQRKKFVENWQKPHVKA